MFSPKLFRTLFAVGILAFSTESAFAQKSSLVRVQQARLKVFIQEDFERPSRTHVSIEKNGKETKLKFPRGKDLDGLRSGMVVNVRGKKDRTGALVLGSDSSSFQVVTSPAAVGVGGTRQAIILRIQSASAVTGASPSTLASLMAQMDGWYQESSFGALSVKNDKNADGVNDIYTVTISDNSAGAAESLAFTYCTKAKDNAKAQHGVDPYSYDHVFCILPPDMNYTWFGQAYVGGKDIVIAGQHAGGYPGGYTHELGHNLGMHHANTGTTEYGDASCVMGGNAGTGKRDFNGPHKLQMNWVPVTTAGTGTYSVNAVEAQPADRIAANTVLTMKDPVTNENLYISYRAPLGSFGQGLNLPYRTSIHSWPGGASKTNLLGSVGTGESFTRNGITVTQLSHSGAAASVAISAQCVAAAPQISIAPSSFASNSGTSARYDITVSNKDVNCTEPVSFALSAALPAGFSGSFASQTITVAPGQSAATSFSATPQSGLSSGKFDIPLSITAANRSAVNSPVNYILDTVAPNAPSLSVAVRKNRASLSWNNPGDALSGVARYRVFRNGALIGTVTTTSFSEPAVSGSSYTVSAVDGAGNESALSNSVAVSTSSKRR